MQLVESAETTQLHQPTLHICGIEVPKGIFSHFTTGEENCLSSTKPLGGNTHIRGPGTNTLHSCCLWELECTLKRALETRLRFNIVAGCAYSSLKRLHQLDFGPTKRVSGLTSQT